MNMFNAVEEIRKRLSIRMDADEEENNKNNKKNNKRGKKHSVLSTRLPFGLCKDAGIDTEGMTPREAWDAYYGKTGISPETVKAQKMGTPIPEKSKDIDIGGSIKELVDAGGLEEQEDGTFINPLTGELFTKEQADEIKKRIEESGIKPTKKSYLSRVIKASGGYDPEGLRDRIKEGSTIDTLVSDDSVEEVADACEKYFSERGDDDGAYFFKRVGEKHKAKKETERLRNDIDLIKSHPDEKDERVKDVVASAPPNTEIKVSGTPYRKKEDGSWERVFYGSRSEASEEEVERELKRGLSSYLEYYKPKVEVYSPTKFSTDHIKDWYESLPSEGVLGDESVKESVREFPDGSIIYSPAYGSGKVDYFAYKKDGEWKTFGSYRTGDWAAVSALSDAKLRDARKVGFGPDTISLPSDERTEPKEPESDLDKKLTSKLKGDSDSVERALRSLKPGDKITVNVGDKSIEYERIKGGIKKDGSYGKVDFGELARSLSDVDGADGVSVTVTGVPRPKATPKTPEEKAAAAERRAAREKIKAEMAKPFVPTGAKYESPDTLSKFDEFIANRQDSLKHDNGLTDEDVDVLRKGFRKMFQDHEYGMRFDASNLKSILDTHFMNQMESRKTHGWHSEFGRARASRQLFGHDQQLDAVGIGGNGDTFEKYGYMPDDPIQEVEGYGRARHYGGTLVTFKKDRVQSRTTYTCDDSLSEAGNSRTAPGRVGEDPGWEGATCSNAKSIVRKFKDQMATGREVKPSEVSDCYLELQYHGRLTFDDVDKIYMNSYDADEYLTDDVKKRLKDKGVKIYVSGRGWI